MEERGEREKGNGIDLKGKRKYRGGGEVEDLK